MKNILVLSFIFLNVVTCFSQQRQNVKCIYKIYTPFDKPNYKPDTASDIVLKSKPLSYVLEIEQTNSKFYPKDEMALENIDGLSLRIRKILSFNSSSVEIDILKDEIFETSHDGTIRIGIKTKISDFKWTITSESKFIDQYKCYKAICQITERGRDDAIVIKDVIAYFCPALNYQCGPREFAGLPGLILELTHNNTVIGLESIVISENYEGKKLIPASRADLKIFTSYFDFDKYRSEYKKL